MKQPAISQGELVAAFSRTVMVSAIIEDAQMQTTLSRQSQMRGSAALGGGCSSSVGKCRVSKTGVPDAGGIWIHMCADRKEFPVLFVKFTTLQRSVGLQRSA